MQIMWDTSAPLQCLILRDMETSRYVYLLCFTVQYGAPADIHNDYYVSKDGKMEQSFLAFKVKNGCDLCQSRYPEWEPDMEGSQVFLNAVLKNKDKVMNQNH